MRPIADSGHGCADRALQALNLSDPIVSRSGPNAPNLVVEADALDAGQTYTFRLAVTTRNPAGTGAAEISFRVNNVRDHARSAEVVRPSAAQRVRAPCAALRSVPQPPKAGSVIVNPADELAFGTSVIISAAEFRCAAPGTA